jgi:hypothetical protein
MFMVGDLLDSLAAKERKLAFRKSHAPSETRNNQLGGIYKPFFPMGPGTC